MFGENDLAPVDPAFSELFLFPPLTLGHNDKIKTE